MASSRESEKLQRGSTRGTTTQKDMRHFQASSIFFAQTTPVQSLQAPGLGSHPAWGEEGKEEGGDRQACSEHRASLSQVLTSQASGSTLEGERTDPGPYLKHRSLLGTD